MNRRPIDNFRPEVHDSDGLLIASRDGEQIWRPLVNPETLLVSSFELKDPVGFGLMQRDLNFDHYQDLEARYDLRPSAWIAPKEKWGKGKVELVQIPAKQEWDDNIVCYWVSDNAIQKQKETAFSYDVIWQLSRRHKESKGLVVATRTVLLPDNETRRFVIDFEGQQLKSLPADAPLKAEVNVKGAEIIEQHIQKNQITDGWRLVFDVRLKKEGPLERVLPDTTKNDPILDMRAYLIKMNEVLTETWSYLTNAF